MTEWSLTVLGPAPAPPAAPLEPNPPAGAVFNELGELVGTTDATYTGDHSCFAVNASHINEGLALLLSQYKGKPRIEKLLRVYLAKVQELEWVFADLADQRNLDTAFGVWLDMIGRIVGQSRQGWTDAEYRKAIRARVVLNRSQGRIDDTNAFVRALYTNVEMPFTAVQGTKAEFTMEMLGYAWTPFSFDFVFALLRRVKAAAVRMLMFFQLVPDADVYTLSSQLGVPETSTTQGLGDVAQTTGGRLRGVQGG